MLLTVVDYGVGNLRSIAKSIEKANSDNNLNYSVKVSSDVNDVKKSDKIVLPGQGSFKACKSGIDNIKGLQEELNESELDLVVSGTKSGVLMVESEAKELSEEIMLGAVEFGFREFQCVIDKIIELAEKSAKDSSEFQNGVDFLKDKKNVSITTNYGKDVIAAVSSENIFGSQFHPEKSQNTGIKILTNFLNL